jgi:hypothetical protein
MSYGTVDGVIDANYVPLGKYLKYLTYVTTLLRFQLARQPASWGAV